VAAAPNTPTFFEGQALARRNTRVMVVFFFLALIAIVLAVDLLISTVWVMAAPELGIRGRPPMWMHGVVATITATTILLVSLWNILTLRAGGGAAVAEMVGARRVKPNTTDPLEKRLVNVVEEMAIAAGTRVPAIYVMDQETGINAFAAGYDVSSAIVAVTRGTLETLTRDELQGVVGHEFSHIVNGDMALNIRMIGVLAGIIFLGAVGGFIMRNVEGDSKAVAGIMAVGAILFAIGYIGLFFARIIKSMVSRQREYLADASSVQFTRNPEGLAGALDQIRTASGASLMQARRAEDVSHLFFGEAITMKFAHALFATHPPLDDRINRVNPRFQPSAYRVKRRATAAAAPDDKAPQGQALGDAPMISIPESALGLAGGAAAAAPARSIDAGKAWEHSPQESVGMIGKLDAQKVDTAQRILAGIPAAVRDRLRDPEGACAALVAMLLANHDGVMEEQLTAAKTAGAGALAQQAREIALEMRVIQPPYYLPIIDLALPTLKLLERAKQVELLKGLQAVIQSDRRVSLFEFVVFTLVRSQLAPRTEIAQKKSLEQARDDVEFILSLVANAGVQRGPNADAELAAAFDAGAKQMGLAAAKVVDRAHLRMEDAHKALLRLRELSPIPKAMLIKGLFATVTEDGTIRVIEAALMRTVSAVLDCPLPPLLQEIDPSKLAA
jgi:Zn-dependent protease with chaperone function